MMVTIGDRPRRRTCFPAIFVWPNEAPCLACPNTARSSESVSTNACSSFEQPGPLGQGDQVLTQHRAELPGVAVGELAQQDPQRRRRVDVVEQLLHPTGADHVEVVRS